MLLSLRFLLSPELSPTLFSSRSLGASNPGLWWAFAKSSWATIKILATPSLAALALTFSNAVIIQGMLLSVGALGGAAAAAVFGASRTISRVPLQLSGLVLRPSLPELTRSITDGNHELTRHLNRVNALVALAATIPFGLALVVFGPVLLSWLSRGELVSSNLVFALLAASAVFNALWAALATPLIAMNRTGAVLIFLSCGGAAGGRGHSFRAFATRFSRGGSRRVGRAFGVGVAYAFGHGRAEGHDVINKLVLVVMLSAFYVLFFSNYKSLSYIAQMGGVALFVAAALLQLVCGRVPHNSCGAMEIALILAALISAISSSWVVGIYSAQYSLVFLATILSAMVLSRSYSFETVLSVTAVSYVLAIVTSLATQMGEFLAALQFAAGSGNVRFRPFGLHPNLTGFVFGAGTLILWGEMRRAGTSRLRFVYMAAVALSLAIVLAASARAGLIAFFSSLVLANLLGMKRVTEKHMLITGFGLVVGVIVFAALGPVMFDYLFDILELGSRHRGLSSGATGRVELWQTGLQFIADRDLLSMLFGTGFRSGEFGGINFKTESSYITLWIELGLILGTAIAAMIVASGLKRVRASGQGSAITIEAGRLLLFVAIQSVFNRYLLAIGNPLSLLMLCAYVTIGRSDENQASTGHAASVADLKLATGKGA